MRLLVVVTLGLVLAESALAARIWTKRERLELTPVRRSALNGVIVGQNNACINWRQGYFQKECSEDGVKISDLPQTGICDVGTIVSVVYVDCRYTANSLSDVPDGYRLDTE